MQHLRKVLIMIFLLTAACTSQAQPLMQTVRDAYKLKEAEQCFIGQPLKILLHEIGPEIKRVLAYGDRAHGALSNITFWFIEQDGYRKYAAAGKRPMGIRVMIKERFEWTKTKEAAFTWTGEDAEKYGDLTIVALRVYGEAL